MAKKKKKQKQKKGGKKAAPAKNYVDNDENLSDYFVEEETHTRKAKKAKKLTGFEDADLAQKKRKAVEQMQQSSESESEEVVQTSGRMSAAQRKKLKKMQQKQNAKEDAERKAREEEQKKAEEKRLARLANKPKRQKRDVKKYDSQGSYYTEESFYEGETDSEGVKRTYKKTKRDVRKVDSEGSYYTEESHYETDEEVKVPKATKPVRKKVRKKREVTKYDSEGSYITDESYSAFESEEEAPEPKNETKNKEEEWGSDESEEEKPVVKKKPEPKKKAVRNRKKAPVNKKDPTKKTRPTMSDDSDSDAPAYRPEKTEEKKTQKVSMFDGFLSESEEEEEESYEEPEPEPEKEPTPEPVETKKQPWKNKKNKNKKGPKKKIEDEFDLDWLNDDSPSKKKGDKKKNSKKTNSEETEELSWIDDDGSKKAEEPKPETAKLSKAALKRQRRKERLKREAEEQGNKSGEPGKKPAARNLTAKQRLRLEKLEKKEEERRLKKEEEERLAEEERKKEEAEQLEWEAAEEERQAEKDKIRKEKNERRKERKKDKKAHGAKRAPVVISGAAADRIALRKKIAEEKKLAKLEQKRKQKEARDKKKAEIEKKKEELEQAKLKKEEEEKQRILDEEKKREEAKKLRKEEEERSKRITEEVRKKVSTKKEDSEEDDGGWDEDDESDEWDADNKKETEGWEKNKTADPYGDKEEEEAGDEDQWEDSTDNEEVQPEPQPEPEVVTKKPKKDQWESESEDEEPPQNYTEDKPVAKPVAEPISEPEEPKLVVEKKKKTWTCGSCLQENQKANKKCTSCSAKKPKKAVDLTNLRAPIGVIMGNVDSGKTSLLDYIRSTKVQSGEAGGITQQIGCTNLPMELIKEQCGEQLISEFLEDIHLPGLLIIDTPGHAAFGNMRERGSTMCDIAILVINMFDGVIGTANACIKMLMENDAPFIVAFNQVDKLYGWEPKPHLSIRESLESQNITARNDFIRNFQKTRIDFANLGLNADLFWESKDVAKGRMKKENVVLVPTSAKSGCGIPDMLLLWIKQCQTRKLAKKLQLTPNLNCTILEVKKVHGQGYCLDVLISDGCLLRGQTIAVCSLRDNGIVTRIKQLQTPAEIQDLRVERARYNNQPKCQASMACRLVCDQNMEHAVAGSKIYLVNDPKDAEEVEDARDTVQAGLSALKNMEKNDIGVMVISSTLGSLEALTKFLKEKANVPMCGWSLGTVHKKEVMRASVMLEHKPEYAVILAFNVTISPDAQQYADQEGVQIFQEEIIYQLEERFLDHLELVKERAREAVKGDVVFPCVMTILEDKIFNRKSPIVMGCHIDKGDLRVGTPLCAVVEGKEGAKAIKIGIVESIEVDSKEVEIGEIDTDVCVKVALTPDMGTTIEYKRHFDHKNQICSMISRRSLDAIKKHYGRDLSRDQLLLLRDLKKKFKL